jgi:hypothetical protein
VHWLKDEPIAARKMSAIKMMTAMMTKIAARSLDGGSIGGTEPGSGLGASTS